MSGRAKRGKKKRDRERERERELIRRSGRVAVEGVDTSGGKTRWWITRVVGEKEGMAETEVEVLKEGGGREGGEEEEESSARLLNGVRDKKQIRFTHSRFPLANSISSGVPLTLCL